MNLIVNALKWLLFVTDYEPLPEPGSYAARITVNGEDLGGGEEQ
jgi:hypothetical protein